MAFAAISDAGGLRIVHPVEDHHRGGRHLQSKFSHAFLAPFFMRTKVLRGKLLRSYSNDNCVGRILISTPTLFPNSTLLFICKSFVLLPLFQEAKGRSTFWLNPAAKSDLTGDWNIEIVS